MKRNFFVLRYILLNVFRIALDEIIPDLPDVTLSYKDFKELVKDLTRRCQKLCEVALEESATKIEDIDEVLLVGGSSKMRVIKDMLRDIFPNKTLSEAINPDEAVAYGATLRAAQLLDPEKSEGFGIMDKLSLGIGVALVENRYEILFKRNTRFPAKSEKKMYCTVFNNQEAMTFDVSVKIVVAQKMLKFIFRFMKVNVF